MCAAMYGYNQVDPLSMLKAANAIREILKKEEEYGDITEEQLKKAMEKKCPEGYKKFIEIGESGKKAEAR